ncbi:unnamed protein product [Paramecium sonneborni]|uniref:Uncharacterized protein n=1 Tax=Paramecium sonneborni TaxID=65129 RepID=A0A8S1RNF1_9CILI|nr:unnamed protein product [Paramecium sonneborni]
MRVMETRVIKRQRRCQNKNSFLDHYNNNCLLTFDEGQIQDILEKTIQTKR